MLTLLELLERLCFQLAIPDLEDTLGVFVELGIYLSKSSKQVLIADSAVFFLNFLNSFEY